MVKLFNMAISAERMKGELGSSQLPCSEIIVYRNDNTIPAGTKELDSPVIDIASSQNGINSI